MNQNNEFDNEKLVKFFSGGAVWIALTVLIIVILGFETFRMGEVSADQVGVVLNKMTGEMEVVPESGVHIYNSIIEEFYTLDKTVQTIAMTEDLKKGDRNGKDDLKVKTIDGSDVYIDIQVRYMLMPEMADTVLWTSGVGDAYKKKWMRDYVRSISRNCLGELTTEEFYDSEKLRKKTDKAKDIVNEKLKKFGLRVTDIGIPQSPHFYKAYEDMIKKKKLADQEKLQEESLADAARQRQLTEIRIADNNKQVELAKAHGEKQKLIIQAKAKAEQIKAEAQAYHKRVKVGADAALYKMQKAAAGILAKKKAEAKGIEAMKEALEGEGGRNMVKMEYAKRLKNIKITAAPITKESHIGRFDLNNTKGE